ncbi:MAG: matrixin family metalloprotease [Byssovorax sp.]
MRCRSSIAALALAAALLGERPASAYCRSSVCKVGDKSVHGKVCAPPVDDDCGTVLQWRQPCVGFALEKNGSRQVPLAEVEKIAKISFAAWTHVDCGDGATPKIEVDDLGSVTCSRVEYNQHAGNANVIVFRDDEWPHMDDGSGSTDTIALTTVTYDVVKGDIFDADMEINSFQNQFTTADTMVDVDLQSVMTHESGHFLGLAHSTVADATMFQSYVNGMTDLRSLSDDDQQAICNAYPPDRTPKGTCDGLPRHGFSPECQTSQTEGTCALSPGSAGFSLVGLLPLAALLGLARRRKTG